jgi:hypothetical protein
MTERSSLYPTLSDPLTTDELIDLEKFLDRELALTATPTGTLQPYIPIRVAEEALRAVRMLLTEQETINLTPKQVEELKKIWNQPGSILIPIRVNK